MYDCEQSRASCTDYASAPPSGSPENTTSRPLQGSYRTVPSANRPGGVERVRELEVTSPSFDAQNIIHRSQTQIYDGRDYGERDFTDSDEELAYQQEQHRQTHAPEDNRSGAFAALTSLPAWGMSFFPGTRQPTPPGADLEKQLAEYKKKVKSLLAANKKLESTKARLEEDARRLRGERSALENANRNLHARLSECSREAQAVLNAYSDYVEKTKRLNVFARQCQQENQKMHQYIQQLNNKNEELRRELTHGIQQQSAEFLEELEAIKTDYYLNTPKIFDTQK
jgi:hypothetical protein